MTNATYFPGSPDKLLSELDAILETETSVMDLLRRLSLRKDWLIATLEHLTSPKPFTLSPAEDCTILAKESDQRIAPSDSPALETRWQDLTRTQKNARIKKAGEVVSQWLREGVV